MLAKFGGRPIIEAVLDNLREAPVDEIIAVVGADAERLREVCERHSVRTVANEEWEWGQSTSVVAGLRASGGRAAVVLLGDQPFVGAEAVERLVAAFAEGAKIAVATLRAGLTPVLSTGIVTRWMRARVSPATSPPKPAGTRRVVVARTT